MNEQIIALQNIIYKIQIGSVLYGTYVEGKSDKDFGGIFIPNIDYTLGMKRIEQVQMNEKLTKQMRNSAGDTDYTLYALPKFMRLCIENNPNIIEFLYAPEHCIIGKTSEMDLILENKDCFLSKKSYHTFKGYAYAQRMKLRTKLENMTGRKELVAEFGWDVKFGSHLIRLLLEGLQILTEKTLTFPLPENNLVRDIKRGKFALVEVIEKADKLESLIDMAYIKSDLQYHADEEKINKLQIKILTDFYIKMEQLKWEV
jgi:predicted nucleotidyltransferase